MAGVVVIEIEVALHAREHVDRQHGKAFGGIARRHFAQWQVNPEYFMNNHQTRRGSGQRPMQKRIDTHAVKGWKVNGLANDGNHETLFPGIPQMTVDET